MIGDLYEEIVCKRPDVRFVAYKFGRVWQFGVDCIHFGRANVTCLVLLAQNNCSGSHERPSNVFSFFSEDPESQPLNNFTCRTFFPYFLMLWSTFC